MASSLQITPEVIAKAHKHNPPGVGVIEYALKKADFYRDQTIVAGYLLNCGDTEQLRAILEKVEPIFSEYVSLRKGGWQHGGDGPDMGNPVNIPLFEFVSKLAANSNAMALVNRVDMGITKNEACLALGILGGKSATDLWGFLITVNMLVKVVYNLSNHMEEVTTDAQSDSPPLPTSENLHRAFAVYRCWSRLDEFAKRTKGAKGSEKKKPVRPAKKLHYLKDFADKLDAQHVIPGYHEADTTEELVFYEPPSASNSECGGDDVDDTVELLESKLEASPEDLVDFKSAAKWLPSMTAVELASLRKYAVDNLRIKYDKWENIGCNVQGQEQGRSIPCIIQKVFHAARRAQAVKEAVETEAPGSGRVQEVSEVNDVDTEIEGYLDHAAMECHSLTEAAKHLDLEKDELRPFGNELQLLRHQVTGCSTMLELERTAWTSSQAGTPVLQAAILGDDMGLGKTVEILCLVHFAHRFGIQGSGERVVPPGPTIVCIPPGVMSSWYVDYEKFFTGTLKMYFVGSSFRSTHDPMFQARVIREDEFEEAVLSPEQSRLYSDPSDPSRTIFIISHHTIAKYTVSKSTVSEGDMLSQDNMLSPRDRALRSDVKRIRTPLKHSGSRDMDAGPQKGLPKTPQPSRGNSASPEDNPKGDRERQEIEDEALKAEGKDFETFVLKFQSKFPGKIYRMVVDEGHAVRHPDSGISRAVKLLRPNFLWLVTATPLLNKTRDFYGYSHLFYDKTWNLRLNAEFSDLPTIEKFKQASSGPEKLELLNPINIRYLAVGGHIPAVEAAVAIPILLRMSMIRRTAHTNIDGISMQDAIPPTDLNSPIITFNRSEQYDYCRQHDQLTVGGLGTGGNDDNGTGEGRIDAMRVKRLLCASITPRFHCFYQRISYSNTRLNALYNMVSKPFAGLHTWLKYTHNAADYQYAVPTTRVDRARELLNMSPVFRYLCKVLYDVVNTKGERLLIFAQTPSIAWIILMFSMNWGVESAWLRAGLTHADRNKIVHDFNDPRGTLRVLITTHQVGGFGLNLQLGGCHHVLIVELPRNLNTLLQSIARLSRIGQKEKVLVWLLTVDHTFHRYWASNFSRKAVSDLGAQLGGKLGGDLVADEATIDLHAEEALNVILGWNESRSTWSDVRCLNLKESLLSAREKKLFRDIGAGPAITHEEGVSPEGHVIPGYQPHRQTRSGKNKEPEKRSVTPSANPNAQVVGSNEGGESSKRERIVSKQRRQSTSRSKTASTASDSREKTPVEVEMLGVETQAVEGKAAGKKRQGAPTVLARRSKRTKSQGGAAKET